MAWYDGNWQGPIRIIEAMELKWYDQIDREKMGVYRLIALEPDGKTHAKLPRICKVDATGTLSIGGSESLRNRMGALVKTHRVDYLSKPHRSLCARLAKDFPYDRLAFAWEYSESPWERERKLHELYEDEFGELPPMDRSS
jgi:hypothetical protein